MARHTRNTKPTPKKHAGAKRTVKLASSASHQTMEQSRFWLSCCALVFMLGFTSIGYKVVTLSIGGRGMAELLTPEENADVSLMALMTEGATPKALGMDTKEMERSSLILPRADITDRNGLVVATSLETASLYANPKEIKEPEEVAQLLSEELKGVSYRLALKHLTNGKSFAWLKRNLSPDEQYRVNKLGVPGLYFQTEHARSYPHGNLFSHVLGYVGVDNHGLAGLESHFDKRLRDKSKQEAGLQLSLDVRVQDLVRNQLQKAVNEFSAIGATGMVMHIPTGEMVSMVSLPDFNPNQPAKTEKWRRFNHATLGAYEMGSTFKTFTMAAGLEYGKTHMQQTYDVSNPIREARFSIRDSHKYNRRLSLPEVFAYSSNIGTVKVIQEVGKDNQKKFLKDLGLFDKVDIELPERSTPLLPKNWEDISMMTISYGHGMSVSPLHLMQAIGALIGDGRRHSPTLLHRESNPKDAGVKVISERTAKHVRRLMRSVVQYGTGRKAAVAGYQVGGKTGTAEKPIKGGYDKDAKLTSFIAAFPMEKPEYLVLVMLDSPKGNKKTYGYATGGWIAAPVVGNIISQMAPMLMMYPQPHETLDEVDLIWERARREAKLKKERARRKKAAIHATSY